MLDAIKAELAKLPGIASSKIGIEANITAADYPLIRLVPRRMQPAAVFPRQAMEVLVYGGVKTSEASAGLEAVHADMFTLEKAIRERMEQDKEWIALWQDTVWDEDRLPHYKLFAMRWRVEG